MDSGIKPDPNNANQHTERGKKAATASMEKDGFFRPGAGAVDPETGEVVVLAGNMAITDVAAELGMNDVIIIETDGTRPIIHVRTDLTPDEARAARLAVGDNFTAAVSLNWDAAVLAQLNSQTPDGDLFEGMWKADEWAGVLASAIDPEPASEGAPGKRSRAGIDQSVVVVAFGRFAAPVDRELAGDAMRYIQEHYGTEPGEALAQLCRDILEGKVAE